MATAEFVRATIASLKLAKEFPQHGLFGVLDQTVTLSIDKGSFAITLNDNSETPNAIVHAALASALFGAIDSKLMIVPKDRSSAFLVEFSTAREQQECCRALLDQDAELTDRSEGQTLTRTSDEALTAEVEQLMAKPQFSSYLGQIDAMLARRRALGLPHMI